MTATTKPRACVTCGLMEDRRKNSRGQEETNLSPLTTQCVDCLIATAKEARTMQMPTDHRARQARNDA